MPDRNEWPRAFTLGSEGGKQTVFRDWQSGMVVEGYAGLFVCWNQDGEQWLMRTWMDRDTGERAFLGIRRWNGWREEEQRRG